MTPSPFPPSINPLMRGLSEIARQQLELVHLPQYAVVPEPGHAPSHVYFPAGCVASLLTTSEDGSIAQAAMIGSEGLLGIDLFLGGATRLSQAICLVHVAGPAFRLRAADFRNEVARNHSLQQKLTRYTLVLVSEMARTAACRRQHSAEQQVSRWLLQASDRTLSTCVAITPESLANLLGLPRDEVAEAVRSLEGKRLVRAADGRLLLGPRESLALASCDCHHAMHDCVARALTCEEAPQRRALARVA